jgi:hypothetical protein
VLAELRDAWAKHDGSDLPGDSGEAPRIGALDEQAKKLERQIDARPARGLPDLIDRAIIAHRAGTASDNTAEAHALIVAVLQLAGIDPAACEI